jgi:signal transduction histidine kinase
MAIRLGRSIAFLCRPDGTVSEILLDEVGLTPQLAPGASFTSLVDSRSLGRAIDFLQRVQDTGRVFGEKLYIANPHLTPVFFYGLRTLGGIAVYGDTKHAKIDDRGNTKLLALAAHDLRNPVAGILAASQFLIEGGPSQLNHESSRLLESIESSSLFLLRLVDDILEFSEMRSGKLRFHFERTDILALTNQSIVMNRSLADSKGIRIVVIKETDIPSIKADPERVSEIIDRLLTNAIRSSPRGRIIEIRVGLRQDLTTISVRDEGCGILANQSESVFEAFCKDQNPEGSGERRTGLGLAIVKVIVEGHGGQVEVESQVGHGTTFTILLPVSGKASKPKEPRRASLVAAANRSAAQNHWEA